MTGSTASNVLPCRSRCGASFVRPFTHASHHAAAGRCVNSWRATFQASDNEACHTASISGAWSRITHILRDGRELSKFCRLGQRFKLLVLQAHTCNAVDQIPQTTNTCQRGDGSPWPCATRIPALDRSCDRFSPTSPLIRSSNVHRQLQTSRELRQQSAAHASGGHRVHTMSEHVCWLFAE